MIPTTFPSTYETTNGETRMVVFFLSSVSGLTKWVDYIPVKFPMLETQDSNSNNNDGVVLVDPLSSTTNKQAWIDYIPVFVDDSDTAAWRVDANGYIPVGFAVKPTLNLDFAVTKTLDPRITFSRTSSATYYDANGVLQTAPAGVARFDHNPTTGESLGLLVEEQRTNLLLNSENFGTTWAKASGTTLDTDVEIAPSGTLTADKFSVGSSGFPQIIQSPSVTVANPHSFSVFVKNAGINSVQLRVRNAANTNSYFRAIFDLTTGAVSFNEDFGNGSISSATSTNVGNGWWRLQITGIADTSGTQATALIIINSDVTPTNGIYIWGAQLEAGAFPTSYIPTTSASVTRNADAASMTGTNFSSWYRADEGSFFYEFLRSSSPTGTHAVFAARQTLTLNSRIAGIFTTSGPGTMRGFVAENNVTQADMFTTQYSTSSPNKFSMAYQTNNFGASGNGGAAVTDASGTVPTVEELRIGQSGTSDQLNGHIRKLAFYPSRLSNAQLQALTR